MAERLVTVMAKDSIARRKSLLSEPAVEVQPLPPFQASPLLISPTGDVVNGKKLLSGFCTASTTPSVRRKSFLAQFCFLLILVFFVQVLVSLNPLPVVGEESRTLFGASPSVPPFVIDPFFLLQLGNLIWAFAPQTPQVPHVVALVATSTAAFGVVGLAGVTSRRFMFHIYSLCPRKENITWRLF